VTAYWDQPAIKHFVYSEERKEKKKKIKRKKMGWRATIVTEEPPPPQINGPTMSSSALNQRLLSIKKTCIDGEGKKE